MRRKRATAGLGLLFTVAVAAAAPATAGTHRRHMLAAPPASAPHSFYPETVEGGVRGNLPFNNQIRKHTDPLNANGAK